MSDINRLPSRFAAAMRNGTTASEAVRNIIKAYDPTWNVWYDNFIGDSLDARAGAAAGTNGTVTVAGGKLTLTATTTDNDSAGQGFGLMWKGDNGFYLESQQALDVLTTAKVEWGITDALNDAGAVNVKATPSATATDFCVLVRDTDDNTQLDVISQKATGVAANAENVHAVVAATNITSIFTGQNDVVGVQVGSSIGNVESVAQGAIEGGTLITPWWFAQSRAGSVTRIFTVEYVLMAGPNGVAP